MNLRNNLGLAALAFSFLLSGCVARTYQVTRDRVDQELPGNRGYVLNKGFAKEEPPRKVTRTMQVVEFEFPSIFKAKPKTAAVEPQANIEDQGVVDGSSEPAAVSEDNPLVPLALEKYTVQKEDTLQKIAKKFYGSSRQWTRIYEANKSVMKAPDRIYPGQVLEIPIYDQGDASQDKHKTNTK